MRSKSGLHRVSPVQKNSSVPRIFGKSEVFIDQMEFSGESNGDTAGILGGKKMA
ncbi:hypothetical protein U1Q18_039644, partial [Sarracenia purpurea var. burkii]